MNKFKNIFNLIFLPLLFPSLLITLCIYQKIRNDSRYGLHPFTKIIAYSVNYNWVDENGRSHVYQTGSELRGAFPNELSNGATHIGYYGEGALQTAINTYLEYICNQLIPRPNIKCQAEISYVINPRKLISGTPKEVKKMRLSYQKTK